MLGHICDVRAYIYSPCGVVGGAGVVVVVVVVVEVAAKDNLHIYMHIISIYGQKSGRVLILCMLCNLLFWADHAITKAL